MYIEQIFTPGIAHSSYVLGGSGKCAIVDPRRDIRVYLEAASAMGLKITHILETHLHADFISGHMDLAKATGAKIYIPTKSESEFDHVPVREGDTFKLDNLEIKVIETPGHTPEHVSYIVSDLGRGEDPISIFCGDTLFVGDVGRPDIFPHMKEELASQLFDSLFDKIMALPDFVEVYPAHGAGSLCGRAIQAKRTSTIGYERKYNSALKKKDRDNFIKSLTTNMPAVPDHFLRCSEINQKGPEAIEQNFTVKGIDTQKAKQLIDNKSVTVLDTRPYDAFGGGHIPGSLNLDPAANFSIFAGWVLPPEKPILLVSSSKEIAESTSIMLRRVGLESIGFLKGGMFEWALVGYPVDHVYQMSIMEMHEKINGKDPVLVLDVRSPGEYAIYHIKEAVNIYFPDLRTEYKGLSKDIPILILCSTGMRSSMAASILKQNGFNNTYVVAGGMIAYNAAGYGPECPICTAPHTSGFMGK